MNDDFVLIQTRFMRDGLSRVFGSAGESEGLWSMKSRGKTNFADFMCMGLTMIEIYEHDSWPEQSRERRTPRNAAFAAWLAFPAGFPGFEPRRPLLASAPVSMHVHISEPVQLDS